MKKKDILDTISSLTPHPHGCQPAARLHLGEEEGEERERERRRRRRRRREHTYTHTPVCGHSYIEI